MMKDRLTPDYSAIIERIQTVTGCKTQMELADFFGVKQSSISDAKRRKAIPAEWLLKLLRKEGLNPDWVLTGQGAKMLQPATYAEAATPPPVHIKEVRQPSEECSIEELMFEIVRRILQSL